MRKLKKIAYLFLTVIICVIFIGCGKKVKKNSTVDLSWYINFSWFSGDWGNNMVSKAITEKQVAPYLLLHQQVILTKN